MNTERKWAFLIELDEKYLTGGVLLSEWTTFIVRDVDIAYCNHANLSALVAAQSAIECHLRYEYYAFHRGNRLGFYDLIEQSPLEQSLKADLHELRRYRNRWVHINDPHDDEALLDKPEIHEAELEEMATFCVRLLRRVLYLEQAV
jgi:hypothetical protein